MNADLHFHPSFFSYGDKNHLTERNYPNLEQICKTAFKKGIDVLTITSCSSRDHIDRRWYNYMNDLKDYNRIKSTRISENCARFECDFDVEPHTIYIYHGQEFKTYQGDLNVIFAEKRISIEKCGGNFYELINMAKDSGENVLVTIPNPSRLDQSTIINSKFWYNFQKIDAFESYDSLDFSSNNNKSSYLSDNLKIPGIAVSDGHRLKDLGKSYISFECKEQDGLELPRIIKERIKNNQFTKIEKSSSNISRLLYGLRLTEAILSKKFSQSKSF